MKNILFVGQRNIFDDFLTSDYKDLDKLIKDFYKETIVSKRFYDQRKKLKSSGLNFITTSDYQQAKNVLRIGFLNLIVFYKMVNFDKKFLSSSDKEKGVKIYTPEIRVSSIENEIPEMYKIIETSEKYTPMLIVGPNMDSKVFGWNIHKNILEENLIKKIMKMEYSTWLRKSNKRDISTMVRYVQELLAT